MKNNNLQMNVVNDTAVQYLSSVFAVPIELKKGDRYNKNEHKQKYRHEFAKDRDRILYSKAFRRLSGKTQVFLSSSLEDVRTRLTHTLEVNQIAVTISTALNLNIELTEAIALGHDVGHTPFGHVGERTINYITNGCPDIWDDKVDNVSPKGFKHNLQSLRVLCDLEGGEEKNGLNLSKYVLWGIANHSSIYPKKCELFACKRCPLKNGGKLCARKGNLNCSFYDSYLERIGHDKYWSFEGLIVAQADEIAQRHHDIEDGFQNGIITTDELIFHLRQFQNLFNSDDNKHNYNKLIKYGKRKNSRLSERGFIQSYSRFIVNFYVTKLIDNIKDKLDAYKSYNFKNFVEVRKVISLSDAKDIISFGVRVNKFDNSFKEFLKTNVLSSYKAQVMDGKGSFIIKRLFKAYYANPNQLSDDAIIQFYKEQGKKVPIGFRSKLSNDAVRHKSQLIRIIADYIGGMTDSQAYQQYDLLYGTRTD